MSDSDNTGPVPDEKYRDFYEAVLRGDYDYSRVVDAERVKRELAEYRETQAMSGRASRRLATKIRSTGRQDGKA